MFHGPQIVGITGGSGSGKSWFARKLMEAFPGRSTLIEQDWYYRDLSELPLHVARDTNFDHPESIEFSLLVAHLDALFKGESVRAPHYEFNHYRRVEAVHPLRPRPLIILEGLLVLQHPETRRRIQRSVFIDAPEPIRFQRRLNRDQIVRGYSRDQIETSWTQHAEPMYERFVKPCAHDAEFIWDQTADSDGFPKTFIAELRKQLSESDL